jgi:hypothetical protein
MATRHPLDGSEPVADGRASIAGCRTDKLADCHDSLLPTHCGPFKEAALRVNVAFAV